jgi:AcrR family transcriptional regulator
MEGVRTPRQKRAQASWEKLLDAAEAVLADEGHAGFTAAALSRRSGISNGGIFWRVDSMDALFVAVHERLIERLAAEQAAALQDQARWVGLTLEAVVAEAVRVQADLFERHGPLLRTMVLRTGSDPVAAERGAAAVRQAGAGFIAHLAPRLATEGCAEPEVVAAAIFRTCFGALVSRITWPEQQGEPEIPWARFVDDVSKMAAAYAARHVARGG